jgi:hypothetical protein
MRTLYKSRQLVNILPSGKKSLGQIFGAVERPEHHKGGGFPKDPEHSTMFSKVQSILSNTEFAHVQTAAKSGTHADSWHLKILLRSVLVILATSSILSYVSLFVLLTPT